MIAVTSTDALTIVDTPTLKHAPSSLPSCIALLHSPSASVWSPDNSGLYISAASTIHKYHPSSNTLTHLFTSQSETVSHLLAKDKASLVFAAADKIYVLESVNTTPRLANTFEAHKSSITSLCLSNDATLLASTSAENSVLVHNLALGSHTAMRGLPLLSQPITASCFHTHARTRLLVASGKQLMVYDTTRPSAPMRTITMSDSTSGAIGTVACSPFSKTLVAVSTAGGFVGLIDLEKEKGLFRTINLKVPLTSLAFSSEGSSLYLGTENGKLLVIDLRALDKPPKSIIISEVGNRVDTLSIQRKRADQTGKISTGSTAASAKVGAELPTAPHRGSANTVKASSKAAPSPMRPRVPRAGSGPSPTTRRVSSGLKDDPSASPSAKLNRKSAPKKIVFSPVRDPLGNIQRANDISVQPETLSDLKGVARKTTSKKAGIVTSPSLHPHPSTSPKATKSASARTKLTDTPAEAKAISSTTRTRRNSPSATTTIASPKSASTLAVPPLEHRRSRTVSSTSRAGRSASVASAVSRARVGSSASCAPSPVHSAHSKSRTPSPTLPEPNMDPITPPALQKKTGMAVLGLGTPEVDAWIRAGNGELEKRREKGRAVGFKDDIEDKSVSVPPRDDAIKKGEDIETGSEDEISFHVSPRRQAANPISAAYSQTYIPSPSTSAPTSNAHELLRTIVQDVMYDFRQESRAEMVGLHLDLVRMGRGWKHELRSLMDEYVGDLRELREENRLLREENQRLRGY